MKFILSILLLLVFSSQQAGDLLPIKQDEKWGFIDGQGELIIPCVYDHAADFKNGNCILKKDGKYGVVDYMANVILPFRFDRIERGARGQFILKKNRLNGIATYKGEVILPTKFQYIERYNDTLYLLRKKGFYGFYNNKGKQVTDFKYGRPRVQGRSNFISIRKGDGYEVLNKNCDSIFYSALPVIPNRSTFYLRNIDKSISVFSGLTGKILHTKKANFIYHSGKELTLIDVEPEGVRVFRGDSCIPVFDQVVTNVYTTAGLLVAALQGKYGVMRETSGLESLPFEFDEIVINGPNSISAKKGDKWALYNRFGRKISNRSFSSMQKVQSDLYQVWDKGKTGLMHDEKGALLPTVFNRIYFDSTSVKAVADNYTWLLEIRKGDIVNKRMFKEIKSLMVRKNRGNQARVRRPARDFGWFLDKKKKKWGLKLNDSIVIRPKFESIHVIDTMYTMVTAPGKPKFMHRVMEGTMVSSEKNGMVNHLTGKVIIPEFYSNFKLKRMGKRYRIIASPDKAAFSTEIFFLDTSLNKVKKTKYVLNTRGGYFKFSNRGNIFPTNEKTNDIGLGKMQDLLEGIRKGRLMPMHSWHARKYYFKDAKWGILDSLGNEVIPAKYDYVSEVRSGLIIAKLGKYWGAIDTGNVVRIPFEYSALQFLPGSKGKFIQCRKVNEKWGIVTTKGTLLSETIYNDVRKRQSGWTMVIKDGKYNYVNATGKFLSDSGFVKARPFNSGVAVVYPNKKWGVIDAEGNYLLAPKFKKLGVPSENRIRVSKSSKSYFLNFKGDSVVGPLRGMEPMINNRSIAKEGRFWGVIDSIGNWIVPAKYKKIEGCSGNRFFKAQKKSKWLMFGHNGEQLLKKKKFKKLGEPSEGFVSFRKGKKYGYISLTTGKIIFKGRGKSLKPFVNGLAVFSKGKKYGAIDSTGKEKIPFEHSSLSSFEEHVSITRDYRKFYLVDTNMRQLSATKYRRMYPVSHDVFRVYFGKDKGSNFVDKEGSYVLPREYNLPYDAVDSVLFVGSASGFALFDVYGNQLTGFEFSKVKSLGGGQVGYQLSFRYGLLSLEGKELLPPVYKTIRYRKVDGKDILEASKSDSKSYLRNDGTWLFK